MSSKITDNASSITSGYNDLTIDAASAYAIDPEHNYETLAALLIFSLLFHSEIIFIDSHFINNPGLRRVARERSAIFECLHLASVQVALRDGFDSLSALMEAQAARGAFAPYFEDDRARYLNEDVALLTSLGHRTDTAYRYDISAQGRKFTTLALHNLKRCASHFSEGADDKYRAFMATLNDVKGADRNASLTQLDFRWDDEKSRLHVPLHEQGLFDWCKRNDSLIYDLQVHAYRMTSSNVLRVRSIIDRKADEIERLIAPAVILNERRVLIQNRYFYARNLSRMTPEVLRRIFESHEAQAFFEARDSKFGTFSFEHQEKATRAYVLAIDRIMTEYAGVLGFTPGHEAHITLITRTSDAFFAKAQSFTDAWSKVERWAEVTLKLELDRVVALALNVEVSAGVLKTALSLGASAAMPLAHAVRSKAASISVRAREAREAELGQALSANVERVTGNTVQL